MVSGRMLSLQSTFASGAGTFTMAAPAVSLNFPGWIDFNFSLCRTQATRKRFVDGSTYDDDQVDDDLLCLRWVREALRGANQLCGPAGNLQNLRAKSGCACGIGH